MAGETRKDGHSNRKEEKDPKRLYIRSKSSLKSDPESLLSLPPIDSNNEMTAEEKKTRRNGLIKFIVFALLVIVAFYFALYNIINHVESNRDDDSTDLDGGNLGAVGKTGCGSDSFMLRDGVCDEVTNTEICLYDGGDCCLEDKDTSMCKVCTCRLRVDEKKIASQFKQLGVRQFKDPPAFNTMIGETLVVKVKDVLSDKVCSVLCLDKDKDATVNAWHFTITKTCRCAWIESTSCIEEKDLQNSSEIESAPFSTMVAFVQMTKMIPCDCLAINNNVSHTITNCGKKITETFSAWHCQQACQGDSECTLFSFDVNTKDCKLMRLDEDAVASDLQIIFEAGILSSAKHCSKFEEYIDIITTSTGTSQESTSWEGGSWQTTEDNDGFCTNVNDVDDCCYEHSVCDLQCSGTDCYCIYGNTMKCLPPGETMEGAHIIGVTESSIWNKSAGKYVADRYFTNAWEEGNFISDNFWGTYPWVQLEFNKEIAVHRIVYINRSHNCGQRFSNAYFHVGNSNDIHFGETSNNPICYIFTGTSVEFGVHDFQCHQILTGKYVEVQMRQYSWLQIGELLVFEHQDSGYPAPENTALSASSTVLNHEPSLAMDSFVGARSTDFNFYTEKESNPWFQLKFANAVDVRSVIIVQRVDNDGDKFANVSLRLGDNPASVGELSTNPEIGFFPGPSQTGRIDIVPCDTSVKGNYFVMQKLTTSGSSERLMFSEVIVYIGQNLCQSENCGRFPRSEDLPNKEYCP